MNDPFATLGLDWDADLTAVRAARRQLALRFHPDHGGDGARMREVNAAFDAAVGHLTGRRPLTPPGRPTSPGAAPPPADRHAPTPGPRRGGRRRIVFGSPGAQHDAPSFVIEALPVEAFEALLVVTSWIGEVLVDEPPYLLEVHLQEPAPCWCRLELVPDAGASTVSVTVVGVGGAPAPDVEAVRDTWVAHLNTLGRLD